MSQELPHKDSWSQFCFLVDTQQRVHTIEAKLCIERQVVTKFGLSFASLVNIQYCKYILRKLRQNCALIVTILELTLVFSWQLFIHQQSRNLGVTKFGLSFAFLVNTQYVAISYFKSRKIEAKLAFQNSRLSFFGSFSFITDRVSSVSQNLVASAEQELQSPFRMRPSNALSQKQ